MKLQDFENDEEKVIQDKLKQKIELPWSPTAKP